MIDLTFRCCACDASVTVHNAIGRKFRSVNGRGYGFGTYHTTEIEDIAPEGWVPFDPYTQVTYCPDCWAEIEQEVHRD